MYLSEQLHDAYTELLARQPWHWFLTLTFKPEKCGPRAGMHPEAADKAFRFLLSNINRDLYGTRWHKKDHGGITWARGQEFHKSGRIHFHAVAASPHADLNDLTRRLDWMDFWYAHFGIARIERPESQADITRYVSKYVAKGGEIDFSQNFGRFLPPDLFRQTAHESGADQTQKPTGASAISREATASEEPQREGQAYLSPRCLTV